jgi:hypothetical protein
MRRFARPATRRKRKVKKKTRMTVPRVNLVERVTKVEKPQHIYKTSDWEYGSRVHTILSVMVVTGKKKREFKLLYSVKVYPTHLVIESKKGKNYTTKIIPLTGEEEIVVKEWQGYEWEKKP